MVFYATLIKIQELKKDNERLDKMISFEFEYDSLVSCFSIQVITQFIEQWQSMLTCFSQFMELPKKCNSDLRLVFTDRDDPCVSEFITHPISQFQLNDLVSKLNSN